MTPSRACDQCHKRKIRCSSEQTGCTNCVRQGKPCTYTRPNHRIRYALQPCEYCKALGQECMSLDVVVPGVGGGNGKFRCVRCWKEGRECVVNISGHREDGSGSIAFKTSGGAEVKEGGVNAAANGAAVIPGVGGVNTYASHQQQQQRGQIFMPVDQNITKQQGATQPHVGISSKSPADIRIIEPPPYPVVYHSGSPFGQPQGQTQPLWVPRASPLPPLAGTPAQGPVNQPVQQPHVQQQPIQQQPVKQQPAQQAAQVAAQQPTRQPIQLPPAAYQPTQQPTSQVPARVPTQVPAQVPAQDPAQVPVQQPSQQPAPIDTPIQQPINRPPPTPPEYLNITASAPSQNPLPSQPYKPIIPFLNPPQSPLVKKPLSEVFLSPPSPLLDTFARPTMQSEVQQGDSQRGRDERAPGVRLIYYWQYADLDASLDPRDPMIGEGFGGRERR